MPTSKENTYSRTYDHEFKHKPLQAFDATVFAQIRVPKKRSAIYAGGMSTSPTTNPNRAAGACMERTAGACPKANALVGINALDGTHLDPPFAPI